MLQPEPCGAGADGRDVESLLLCDVVAGEVVGTALAVYEYDTETGNPVGPPTFVDPVTGTPYVPVGVLQPCPTQNPCPECGLTSAELQAMLPLGVEVINWPAEIEVKNDSGLPLTVDGTVELDAPTLEALYLGQILDANNSEDVDAIAAQPGVPWVGAWALTRDIGVVGERTVFASTNPAGSGTMTFEFAEDISSPIPLGSAPISESRHIDDFVEVRETGSLDNFGKYYRTAYEPDDPLGADLVFVVTQLYKQPAPPFVRLADQELELANAALGSFFTYGKAFNAITGKSENIPPPAISGTDADNQTTPILAANQVWTGNWKDVESHGSLVVAFAWLVAEAPLSVQIEYSDDQAAVVGTTTLVRQDVVSGPSTFAVYLAIVNGSYAGKFARPKVTNTPTPQTALAALRLFARNKFPYAGSFAGLNSSLSLLSQALLVRSVNAAFTPDEEFQNLRAQGRHEANCTVLPLAANDVWRGEWFPWSESYVKAVTAAKTDVPGTFYVDFSEQIAPVDGDESSLDDWIPVPYDPTVAPILKRQTIVQTRWVRSRWVNGPAGQTEFNLGTAFLTTDPGVSVVPATQIPTPSSQLGMVRNIPAIPSGLLDVNGNPLYHEVPVDATGVPTTRITVVDDDLLLRGLPTTQVRQFTIGPTPVQLDMTKLADRRSASITCKDATNAVHIGHHPGITPDLDTFPIYARTEKGGGYGEDVDLWAVCGVAGSTETVSNLTGSSATGTATSPSNALTSNDVDATFDAVAEFVNVTGFAAGTTNALVSVKIGIEGAKQAGQFETSTWQETQPGVTAGSGTVATTAAVAGGTAQFYLATITRNANTGTVTGVSGLGLTWTALVVNITSGNRRIDVWYAVGDGTTGIVTASLSTSTNAHIAVGRYSNVDQTTPIQASNSTTGTGTAVTGPALAGTNKGYSILSVSHLAASGTPGAGYTERSDASNGSGGNVDSIYVENKALTATGSETATATLATSVAWAAIGVTLNPVESDHPVIRMSYEYNNVAGPTTGDVTLDLTSDVTTLVDVTGDRSWTASDIAFMEVIGTLMSLGAATALVDRLFVQITDTTAVTVRVSLREIA